MRGGERVRVERASAQVWKVSRGGRGGGRADGGTVARRIVRGQGGREEGVNGTGVGRVVGMVRVVSRRERTGIGIVEAVSRAERFSEEGGGGRLGEAVDQARAR